MSEPDEDFAAMFEASLQAKRFEKGQTIEGTIVAIGPEVAFVNVGGKGEAMIEIDELKDDDGALEVAVGDRIQAMVVSTEGGLTLSRKLARGAATAAAARRRVPRRSSGGRQGRTGGEGRIRGAHRPPARLLPVLSDRHRPEHGSGGARRARLRSSGSSNTRKAAGTSSSRGVRCSRRSSGRSAAEIRRSIVAGAVMTGRVTSVREFGAFVDLGAGVQGLLHVSEMGWSRVSDTSQVVKPGEEITVKVLRVDDDKQKISLGLKQLTADPWSTVQATYEVGQVRTGRVTRLAEFGAFVELEPGVEGLAHASTFAPTGQSEGWSRSVAAGMTAAFEILSIDLEKKRIGVALVPEGSARAAGTPATCEPLPVPTHGGR